MMSIMSQLGLVAATNLFKNMDESDLITEKSELRITLLFRIHFLWSIFNL